MLLIVLVGGLLSCSKDDDNKNNNPGGNDPLAPTITEVGNTVRIRDNGGGIGTRTLTANKTWILENLVFVNSGQTLTIEPGTVIKGAATAGENAAALAVARGGRLLAEGTAEKPIIFTAEEDDVNNPNEAVDKLTGRWGGVLILGRARTNTIPSEQAIEGIPTTETRALFGGSDDSDNSGVIKYVSIRHGGALIGPGNEINGLTLGGVGSGTVIENVEITFNSDDGIELFGGTVNVRNLILAFNEDDYIDYDMGYRGKIQNVLILQGNTQGAGDRGFECDGGTDPEDGQPYATPTIANVTSIGAGATDNSRRVATFRDNAGGYIHNSLFIEFGRGIDVEDNESGEDSKARLDAGQLAFNTNQFHNVGNGQPDNLIYVLFYPAGQTSGQTQRNAEWFNKGNNIIRDPGLRISYTNDRTFNPIPTGDVSGAVPVQDSWFQPHTYRGAFAPGGTNWMKRWSFLDTHGYLAN
jgi:hypothetical protein